MACFNEAVGYYRRKHAGHRRDGAGDASMRPSDIPTAWTGEGHGPGFNEAVGYYRRKLGISVELSFVVRIASMRPSDITDGNLSMNALGGDTAYTDASMRPSDITDGNAPGVRGLVDHAQRLLQ